MGQRIIGRCNTMRCHEAWLYISESAVVVTRNSISVCAFFAQVHFDVRIIPTRVSMLRLICDSSDSTSAYTES